MYRMRCVQLYKLHLYLMASPPALIDRPAAYNEGINVNIGREKSALAKSVTHDTYSIYFIYI